MKKLSVRDNRFFLDEKPLQILSGAVHYFRIVPEYWEDRLLKVKAAGLNTVETYIPWNLHEPQKGRFNFTGIADVERFIRLAGELGLYVIIRPSPYICAEWEGGGLPSWLLQDSSLKIRCCCRPYLERVKSYYHELLPRLVSLQIAAGGPIIAMQIENEYGSFGNDTQYLQWLQTAMEDEGITMRLFTSDGPTHLMLAGGTIPDPDIVPTVNFGSKPEESFKILNEHFPAAPQMVTEFWNGWFDHWGERHHTQKAEEVAQTFERMLKSGASVNFYMFHGGTNFGFYNGANFGERYEPTVTSYDYDCPISEWGDLTPKYTAIRDAIMRHTGQIPTEPPAPLPRIEPGRISSTGSIGLFDALSILSQPLRSAFPLTMEQAGQDYGFILYRTELAERQEASALSIKGLKDRALVFFNKRCLGVLYRNDEPQGKLTVPAESGVLEILVENMGRINYGSELFDAKGITKGVYLDYQCLFDWKIFPLPLHTLKPLPFAEETTVCSDGCPVFYRFNFSLEQTGDTFIDMSGWTKGSVFANDFNIGRYWNIGPQKRLYIPAPLLRKGSNSIIVFELHGTAQRTVYLSAEPNLGSALS